MKTWLACTVIFFLAVLAVESQAMTVGRVYSVEGDLLRYVPADNDWVAMVNDTPFGAEDTFFSGNQGRAEMFVPNGTWLRVGDSTQVQFIVLDPNLTELDVSSGVARLYNKGSDTLIKATSPFGYVMAYPGTAFDLYVGENSVEIVVVEGTVSFVHTASDSRYEVAADSPSLLADDSQVASGDGAFDDGWHRWNVSRERLWAEKSRLTGRSVEYLPPSLHNESYALEENGRWESVRYEGSSRWFWRPTTVTPGWSPFTAGRWTDWHGDQVWIPSEPFGYVTHHYGNWIHAQNAWYWAPPVASIRVGLPLLDIGLFWSPGRVSWIHHDDYVGWVPLGPRETYYSHRRWGGAHDALYTGDIRISINIGSYAYARQAIVVPRENFYRVDDYRTVQVNNVNSTKIINTYNAAPVVNNTVINNYLTDPQRYTFTSRAVEEKPHISVVRRIEENTAVIQRAQRDDSVTVQRQVSNLPEGRLSRSASIETPISTNYFVPESEVNRPTSEIRLRQKKVKAEAKPNRNAEQEQVLAAQPAQSDDGTRRTLQQPSEQPTVMATSPQMASESQSVPQQKKGSVAPAEQARPERPTVEQPRKGKQPPRAVAQPQVQPAKNVEEQSLVEQPRKGKQPPRAIEQAQAQPPEKAVGKKPEKAQPQAKGSGKKPEAQPARNVAEENVVEQAREDKQPQRAVEQAQAQPPERVVGKKPEKAQPQEKGSGKKPEAQPARDDIEQTKQGKQPAGKQIEKAPTDNEQETELSEEELEILRLQEKQEQERGSGKGKSGKK